jgi:hypothetical protein
VSWAGRAIGGERFLERSDVGVDDDGSVVEVGVVALQSGHFAPAAAGPGCGDDEDGAGAVAELFGLLGTAQDLLGGGPQHFLGDAEGAFAAAVVAVHQVGGDQSVRDGVAEDAAEQADDAFDGGVFVAGGV